MENALSTDLQDLPGEIWKDIKGYEGYYKISNFGRVKTLSRISCGVKKNGSRYKVITPERIRKPSLMKIGYYGVILNKDKKYKGTYIHRLLGLHFIENKNNGTQINHINGIKTDNRLENLEWVSAAENIIHAKKIGLMKPLIFSNLKSSRFTKDEVYFIRYVCDNGLIKKRRVARYFNVCHGTIVSISNRINYVSVPEDYSYKPDDYVISHILEYTKKH